MKPIIAPFLFPAAVFMASACAPVSVAAAMDGSRSMAVRCACLMSSASSSGRLMGFMAMETTCRPRSSPHLARERLVHERRKLLGVAGRALGRTSSSEMRAKAGCSALMNSVLSMLSISERL